MSDDLKVGGKAISELTEDELRSALHECLRLNVELVQENRSLTDRLAQSVVDKAIEDAAALKIITGALRTTVADHGASVEGSWIGSASKRIWKTLVGAAAEPSTPFTGEQITGSDS